MDGFHQDAGEQFRIAGIVEDPEQARLMKEMAQIVTVLSRFSAAASLGGRRA